MTGIDNDRSCVTINIGVSESSSGGRQIEETLKRADGAMYEAKRRGRNTVMTASSTYGAPSNVTEGQS